MRKLLSYGNNISNETQTQDRKPGFEVGWAGPLTERQLNALLMLARALPKNQQRQGIVRKLQAEAMT